MMLKRNSHLGKPRNSDSDAQSVPLCIDCALSVALQPTSGIVFIVFRIWCCRPLQSLTTSTLLLY